MVLTGRRRFSAALSPLLISWITTPGASALRVGLASTLTTRRGGAVRSKADRSEHFFAALANDAGVECAALGVKDFHGIRGVFAREDLPSAARAIAVPSSEALQARHALSLFYLIPVYKRPPSVCMVTTVQPRPSWAPEAIWKGSKWDTRLALCLLRASSEKPISDARRQWLCMLPDSFNTPFFWSEEKVASLGYDPAVRAIFTQRQEWAARYDQAPRLASWWAWYLHAQMIVSTMCSLSAATKSNEKDFELPSRERFYWALS
eukprot:6207862-Pleurochrysis_carterae.AAC.2